MTPKTKSVLFRDILTEWERKAGHKPDILHLWGWSYRPQDDPTLGRIRRTRLRQLWADNRRSRRPSPTCRTTSASPCPFTSTPRFARKDTPTGQRLADKALQLPDGKPFIRYPDTYCMCHATPEWIEHQIQTYQRLVRETGAKMLYVDQQATVQDIVNKTFCVCFHPGHGHPVPNRVNETDHRFIRALREAVPGRGGALRRVPLHGHDDAVLRQRHPLLLPPRRGQKVQSRLRRGEQRSAPTRSR